MKLVHLTSYFFPEYSGTSTRLYNLLCRLPAEVLLLTSNRMMNGELITEGGEQLANIKIKRLPLVARNSPASIPVLRYLQTVYSYQRRPTILMEATANEKWDITQVHNVIPLAKAARNLATTHHTPLVSEIHGIAEESLSGTAGLIGNIYLKSETKKLLRDADLTITLTQSLKKQICQRYQTHPEKIVVVPNGADIEHFSAKPEYRKRAADLKEELNLTDKVVMYAGALDSINGIGDLSEAIPDILRERSEVSFVFIGDGPEQKKLLLLAKSYPQNVRCLGQVPYGEMPIYYQMCDTFIIPRPSTISSETLTPLKLLEAMASEKTVLGSNVGGIAEVIRSGENGYLFKKGDQTSLKETLLEVLDTDNIEIGKNARKTITEKYTWDSSARILQGVYQDIIGS